jgi:tetratricopeptide (TPR) repeat protein
MQTKISQYTNGIMEASWIAALILVPLYFNVYSSRIFEPDKIAILRSLSLLILGVWIVKIVDQGGFRLNGDEGLKGVVKFITSTPLLLPVLSLAIVYIISTIFSIVPSTSFLGSYQRLQGTYTTLSYLVIFAAIAANLREREQIERIITTAILVSLPVSLYGVLQKLSLDPIPWGGDTSTRIASNMGNSIFVAAYLIMIIPLTISRMISSFTIIVKTDDKSRLVNHFIQGTIYVTVLALQIIAVLLTQSRGPFMGMLISIFGVFILLYLFIVGKRKIALAWSILLALGAIGLILFNIDGGPLESLRSLPQIGRYGQLLDPDSNSAKVRRYIWQGTVDLVLPHEPLEFPDGSADVFNPIRPLVGYGPESMYVAYNPFYIPELAYVERRNASPDRSHNETWDSVVITGFLGMLVYIALFELVFYYGLKWLGVIASKRQQVWFFALSLGGGLLGAIALSLWRGPAYLGVGIPFGILAGLIVYLMAIFFFAPQIVQPGESDLQRRLLLAALLAAIVAHFAEINFGIAIVSTRTHFWTYAALMLVIGYWMPIAGKLSSQAHSLEMNGSAPDREGNKDRAQAARKKRRSTRQNDRMLPDEIGFSMQPLMLAGLIIGLVLATLGFNYINNPRNLTGVVDILVSAFTRLPNKNNAYSPGILLLLATTWVAFSAMFTAEISERRSQGFNLRQFAGLLGVSGAVGLVYWLWHAGTLSGMARFTATNIDDVLRQVGKFEGMIAQFYVYILLVVFSLAMFLLIGKAIRPGSGASLRAVVASIIVTVGLISLVSASNLRVIQADVVFKLTEPFSRGGQWPLAIRIYNHANELAPTEDYYYLFLGRAYLEQARTLTDPAERNALIEQAAVDLKKAQEINPLNTDHTANLARLYSLWASMESEPTRKQELADTSIDYFSEAVTLSPHSARLWSEWALLYLNILGQPEDAIQKINQALEIDPKYHWGYALQGEYYARNARQAGSEQERLQLLELAIDSYSKATEMPINDDPNARYNYSLALGSLYVQAENPPGALEAYLKAMEYNRNPADNWRIQETIASIYAQTGDVENAMSYAQMALASAPEDQKSRIQSLIDQIQQIQP